MNLVTYFSLSLIVAASAVYYSFQVHEQFYPTVLYLTNNKICILGLGNFGFSIALTFANLVVNLLFIRIHDDESNEIIHRAKYAITEICIALASFRNEINISVVVLFTGLLFMKVFHWLAGLRMENFARAVASEQSVLRLFITLIFLLTMDFFLSAVLGYIIYQQSSFGVLVFFAFEFLILSAAMLEEICRLVVLIIDRRYEGRWEYKPSVMFLIELIHDITHLALYAAFVLIMMQYGGFPLYLLREIFLAIRQLKMRVTQFIAYRKILKVIDTQFPTLTAAAIEASERDIRCVICFGDMTNGGKELPCRHVFHLNCLKRWFEQKQECPMCRTAITPDPNAIALMNARAAAPPQPQPPAAPQPAAPPAQAQQRPLRQPPPFPPPPPFLANLFGFPPAPPQPPVALRTAHGTGTAPISVPFPATDDDEKKQSMDARLPPPMMPPYPHMFGGMPPPPPPLGGFNAAGILASARTPEEILSGLRSLTKMTQMQMEYHQLCVGRLESELESYIALQHNWRQTYLKMNDDDHYDSHSESSIVDDTPLNSMNSHLNADEMDSGKSKVIAKRLQSFSHLESGPKSGQNVEKDSTPPSTLMGGTAPTPDDSNQ